MPLFEYHCHACQEEFEALVTAKAAEVVRCPKCDSTEVSKQFGLPSAKVVAGGPATNCRGDGPPCGAVGCGRKNR